MRSKPATADEALGDCRADEAPLVVMVLVVVMVRVAGVAAKSDVVAVVAVVTVVCVGSALETTALGVAAPRTNDVFALADADSPTASARTAAPATPRNLTFTIVYAFL